MPCGSRDVRARQSTAAAIRCHPISSRVQSRHGKREEQGGERGIEPEAIGSGQPPGAYRTDGGAAHPARQQQASRAHQTWNVHPSLGCRGDGPRFIDHGLAFDETGQPRAEERAARGQAHRQVASVHGGGARDGRMRPPPAAKTPSAANCRIGERDRRHRHRGPNVQSRSSSENPERDAKNERRPRQGRHGERATQGRRDVRSPGPVKTRFVREPVHITPSKTL